MKHNTKLVIGFIVYNEATAKYLSYFLTSLKNQTDKDFKILVLDNSDKEDNSNKKYIKENYPDIAFAWSGKNLGFARAYNRLIDLARKKGAKYFLALNPDMVLAEDFVEKILISAEKDNVGAVAPKILYWDFENRQRTKIIDSTGIFITREHRFSDSNQGEIDDGRFDKEEQIFGFTGAAVLFKLDALVDVAYKNKKGRDEYFDELMFMYKEDCDLSYRLRLAGWDIVYAPEARAFHHRLASPKGEGNLKIALNRKNKSKQVKKWSFLNHWILLLKFSKLPYPVSIKFASFWYQFKSLVFAILFEPYLLLELAKLFQARHEIKQKRQALKIRINIEKIKKLI